MRKNFASVPAIVLSHATQACDVVAASAAGADDVVAKPAREVEFLARMAAMLRRTRNPFVGAIEIGRITIDTRSKSVCVEGDFVKLTPLEYEIFEFPAKSVGKVV